MVCIRMIIYLYFLHCAVNLVYHAHRSFSIHRPSRKTALIRHLVYCTQLRYFHLVLSLFISHKRRIKLNMTWIRFSVRLASGNIMRELLCSQLHLAGSIKPFDPEKIIIYQKIRETLGFPVRLDHVMDPLCVQCIDSITKLVS